MSHVVVGFGAVLYCWMRAHCVLLEGGRPLPRSSALSMVVGASSSVNSLYGFVGAGVSCVEAVFV
eukprot:1558611-Prorocentrum_lima.AAC.1